MPHFFNDIWNSLRGESALWSIFGFVGNLLFASRFVIQWYVSERLKRSVIPVQFWYLSIAGSVMLLIYSIHIGKIPLIVGFLFPTIIYIRNLMLIWKHERRSTLTASDKERFPVTNTSEESR